MIDYTVINEKLMKGMKLRIDVGLSMNMPNTIKWLNDDEDVYVVGIEPHPNNFKSCCSHLETHHAGDRCYLIEAAVDNVAMPTQRDFYGLGGPATGNDPGTSSLCKPIGRFEGATQQVYSVECLPLSDLCNKLAYNKVIDVVKTDTQGRDLNVLRSLGEHIKNVKYIYAEYDESEDYEGGNTGEELEAFLQEVGFERYNTIRVPERNNKIVDCEYRNLNINDSDRGPRWNSD